MKWTEFFIPTSKEMPAEAAAIPQLIPAPGLTDAAEKVCKKVA